MRIVVVKQVDDAGVEFWGALSADKNVGAYQPTPELALAEFIRWLRLSEDPSNEAVPSIFHMVEPDPVGIPANSAYVLDPTKKYKHIDGRIFLLGPNGELVCPPPYPLYGDASESTQAKFESGEPYAPPGVVIPEGWDVRREV